MTQSQFESESVDLNADKTEIFSILYYVNIKLCNKA